MPPPTDRPKAPPRPKPAIRAKSSAKSGDTGKSADIGAATGPERIAKVLARAGIASRRDAERMITAGEVAVNGKVIDSPALNVAPTDRITVNGKAVAAPEPARLWLFHKPEGLVTSARDEKGRQTVFDVLPPDLPRVMTVGRLDLASEGLLLLTNDGELKRRLELPSTGWLRRYRVRVHGTPEDTALEPLRKGIEIEGEKFQPMTVTLDRQQASNAWLTVGLREGRNREVRRAMAAVGLVVNRLIRVGYGPFRLGELAAGAIEEVRPRVLRDQLGLGPTPDTDDTGSGATKDGTSAARTRVRGKPGAAPAARRQTEMPRASAPAGKPKSPRATGSAARAETAGARTGRTQADRTQADRTQAGRTQAGQGHAGQPQTGRAQTAGAQTRGAQTGRAHTSGGAPAHATAERAGPGRTASERTPSGRTSAPRASEKPAGTGPGVDRASRYGSGAGGAGKAVGTKRGPNTASRNARTGEADGTASRAAGPKVFRSATRAPATDAADSNRPATKGARPARPGPNGPRPTNPRPTNPRPTNPRPPKPGNRGR